MATLVTKVHGRSAVVNDLFERVLSDPPTAAAWYGSENTLGGGGGGWNAESEEWVDAWRTIEPSPQLVARVRAARNSDDVFEVLRDGMDGTPYASEFGPNATVDSFGWTRHRYLARRTLALLKMAVACGVADEALSTGSFVDDRLSSMTVAQIADAMKASVDAFDEAAAHFLAQCPLSVCYYDDGDRLSSHEAAAYFVGLSPHGGHLVGAMTMGTWAESA